MFHQWCNLAFTTFLPHLLVRNEIPNIDCPDQPSSLQADTSQPSDPSCHTSDISDKNSTNFRCLNIYFANCRSICNKIPDLNLLLSCMKYDISILCETWLNLSILSSILLNNSDYSIFRADRVNRVGGGICILYRNFLKASLVPINHKINDIELLCIDLLGSPIKYRLVACYVPPCLNDDVIIDFLNFFETSNILPCNSTTIVRGDFNIPSNRKLTEFHDVMIENGFTQYVNSPTRGDHVLDLVFVNDDFAVSDVEVGPPFSTSDHNSINFNLVYLPPASSMSALPKYKFDKDNLKLICDYLKFVNWFIIFDTEDLEKVWSNFTNTIFISVDKYAIKIEQTPSTYRHKSYPKHINRLLSRKKSYGKHGKLINPMCLKGNIKKLLVNVD